MMLRNKRDSDVCWRLKHGQRESVLIDKESDVVMKLILTTKHA